MTQIVDNSVHSFQQACRAKNLRVTPQRIEIYRELALAKDHPTAEMLYRRLEQRLPMLSLDTVYRTLGTFSELGLVNRVDTAESHAHFEVAQQQHHHLICENCKKIVDFSWEQVDRTPLPAEVAQMGAFERKNVVVYGTCNSCIEQQQN